jgi:hypothetical protein
MADDFHAMREHAQEKRGLVILERDAEGRSDE